MLSVSKLNTLSRGDLIKYIVKEFHISGKDLIHFKKIELIELLTALIQRRRSKEEEQKHLFKDQINIDPFIKNAKVGEVTKQLSDLKLVSSLNKNKDENPFQSPKQKIKKHVSIQIDDDDQDIQKTLVKTVVKTVVNVKDPKHMYISTKQSNLLHDDYIVISRLGKGSYGEVLEIERKVDKVHFALKKYFDFIDCNEVDILSRFDHPNLLRASDRTYNESKKEFNLFLPLGKTSLDNYVNKYPFNIELICDFFNQLVSATLFLHENGYYHCDIKPQNVLLFETNQKDSKGNKKLKLVLADFGLVYPLETKIEFCGTTTYTSFQGLETRRKAALKKHISKDKSYKHYLPYVDEEINFIQTDIYSIGTTILYCLRQKNYMLHTDTYEEGYKNLYAYANGYMSSQTDSLTKECYNLILSMIEPSQINRMKSLTECFTSSLFKMKGYTPIKGNVIIPPLLSSNIVCNTILKDTQSNVFKGAIRLYQSISLNVPSIPIAYSVLLTLVYRCLQYDLDTFFNHKVNFEQKITCIITACLILTAALFDFHSDTTISVIHSKMKEYNMQKICTEDIMKQIVYKIIVTFNGILRIPTLYDESKSTPNLICKWLEECSNNCQVILMNKYEFISWFKTTYGEDSIKPYLVEHSNQTVFNYKTFNININKKPMFEFEW